MKKTTFIQSLATLAVVTCIDTTLFAQNTKEPPVKANNNFQQMLDYSRPGKYHQLFANLAGEWSFKGSHYSGAMHPDSNKVVVTFSGKLVRTPYADGRFFIVELTGGAIQVPIQGGKMKEDLARSMETEGYNNVTNKFNLTFINNHLGSGIIFSEGSYDPAARTIFFEWEEELTPGKKRKVHEHFVILDDDHYRLEYYRERDGRKIKSTEINCTRTGSGKTASLTNDPPDTGVVFPAPGRFHKLLTRSCGTWTGEGTMWFSPGAPPVTSTSILRNTMVMGGLYQVSEIKGNILPDMGKPWTGVRITGYDNDRKIFTRAMIGDGDASGGVGMEGPWDDTTHSITMPFKKASPLTGRERNLKEVYSIIDENTELLEIFAIDPKTNKEFKMLSVKWTRKN